ncbi:YjcZ family sporulation protein [Neobacillus sp. K501]
MYSSQIKGGIRMSSGHNVGLGFTIIIILFILLIIVGCLL